MIYFEVLAGLCNRLRGMAAAYAFAKEMNTPLTIIWEKDINCNCSFDALFHIAGDIKVDVITFDCMGTTFLKRLEHQKNKLYKKHIQDKCNSIYALDLHYVDVAQLKKAAERENIYLKSFSYWYPSQKPFQFIQLNADVKKKVEKMISMCGTKKVGVHIRRTDHQVCINKSPTDAFIREMKKEDADTVFYIATDDEKERRNFETVFGNERIVYNSCAELSRGTTKGMEDAVVDLYTLAGMNKILGSDSSSFTEVAGMIGNIPVVICH